MAKTLVLQGGAYKGVYQLGVLDQLKDIKFDAIFGTSVGALNALFVACGYHHAISDIWTSVIYDGKVFHKKSWKYYFEIVFKHRLGLYENTLSQMISDVLTLPNIIQQEFYVTVVDFYYGDCYYVKIFPNKKLEWWKLQDGKLKLETEEFADNKKIADIITASTSVPGYFKPIMLNNMMLYDGGVRDIAPLNGAVITGAKEILCILCSPGTVKPTKEINRLDKVLARAIDIQTNEVANEDIRKFLEYNEIARKFPEFNTKLREIKIDIIKPEYHLLSNSLEPNKQDLLAAYQHGTKHGQDYANKEMSESLAHVRKHKMNDK